jgi:hypothetical protein
MHSGLTREVSMFSRKDIIAFLVFGLVAGIASGDFKVTKKTHRDGFSVMGRDQPATDQEEVTWIGADRLRVDQGDSSVVIRLDTNKMMILHHASQTYNAIELPIDLNNFLPPQMAEQMLGMMTLEVTVTPSDESQKIGNWQARRYGMKMTSQMMTVESTVWATSEVEIDLEAYRRMIAEIINLQPGASNLAKEMDKIDGFVISQESAMTMAMLGDSKIGSTEKVTSIEENDPPSGNYDVPEGYELKPFDYMAMMQEQQ